MIPIKGLLNNKSMYYDRRTYNTGADHARHTVDLRVAVLIVHTI